MDELFGAIAFVVYIGILVVGYKIATKKDRD